MEMQDTSSKAAVSWPPVYYWNITTKYKLGMYLRQLIGIRSYTSLCRC